MMNLDGYCTLVNIQKNKSDYQNVYKTLFYPLKIDSYMEKHRIYEIVSELLVQVGMEMPSNDRIIDFMIAKLIEINENLNAKQTTKIEFHNCQDESIKMLKKLSSKLQIPINYDSSNTPSSCNNHHNIIFDFKDDPHNGKFMRIFTDVDNSNIRKSPECNLKLKSPIDSKLCYNNLEYVIQNAHLPKPLKNTHGKWNHRVLVVGRVGSGRKTQTRLLAKEFGLIFMDFDWMIVEYSQHQQQRQSLDFWGYVQKILLKPQYLHNGYAIVSNVINRMCLERLMETFLHPPNLIIFIHTNENKCRQRLLKQKGIYADVSASINPQIPTACADDLNAYLDHQMNLYNLHRKDFSKYFTTNRDLQQKIYHVNGNGFVNDIKSCIWARLCRT